MGRLEETADGGSLRAERGGLRESIRDEVPKKRGREAHADSADESDGGSIDLDMLDAEFEDDAISRALREEEEEGRAGGGARSGRSSARGDDQDAQHGDETAEAAAADEGGQIQNKSKRAAQRARKKARDAAAAKGRGEGVVDLRAKLSGRA